MSGLIKIGVDASPFGSKFKDVDGGFDAGNGQRTYTRPSYTLFVTSIPDAESSDAVEAVFRNDHGFMQCRPIGHKKSRRMVFVDFDCIEHATSAMKRHQGHKWEEVDEGLKIDYDQDARCKRNTALDEGMFEKFWPIGPRVARAETDQELFARLRAEAASPAELSASMAPPAKKRPLAPAAAKARAQHGAAARLQVKKTRTPGPEGPAQADCTGEAKPVDAATTAKDAADAAQPGALGGLAQYESESEDDGDFDEDADDDEEEEEEESGEADAVVDAAGPAAKKPRV